MKNKKIIGVLLALIIIAGVVITAIWGLNFSFLYNNHKELDIYIGQEFKNDEIRTIVKEIVGNQKVVIQKVELYEELNQLLGFTLAILPLLSFV